MILPTRDEPKFLSKLVVPREEAKDKIERQLGKGRALMAMQLTTATECDSADRDRRKWLKYTRALLASLFEVDSVAREFVNPIDYAEAVAGGGPSTLERKVSKFKEKLSWDTDTLESILDRLDFHQEAWRPRLIREIDQLLKDYKAVKVHNSQGLESADEPEASRFTSAAMSLIERVATQKHTYYQESARMLAKPSPYTWPGTRIAGILRSLKTELSNGHFGDTQKDMARRTSGHQPNEPLPTPSLTVSREEATQKIGKQLEQGKALAARTINSQEEFEHAKSDQTRWVEFTTTLLGRLFTNTKLAEEFRQSGRPLMAGTGQITDDLQFFLSHTKIYLNKLESIQDQLELFDEPTQQAPATQTRQRYQPQAAGSPFGFRDEDWELVTQQRRDTTRLYVVLGFQWESTHYNSEDLKRNVQHHFADAVQWRNENSDTSISLVFEPLGLGAGEHAFNRIARKIIGADIAVFETSDQNPNVFLELGVALTWDVAVVPIKRAGSPKPPSDISGQSWFDHEDSGRTITSEPKFDRKIMELITRVMRNKKAQQ